METETLGEPVAQRYAEVLKKKLASGLRKVDVETVNETEAEVKAQKLVDTVRHTSTDGSRRTWQHTTKNGRLGSSRHTDRQTSRGLGPDT